MRTHSMYPAPVSDCSRVFVEIPRKKKKKTTKKPRKKPEFVQSHSSKKTKIKLHSLRTHIISCYWLVLV